MTTEVEQGWGDRPSSRIELVLGAESGLTDWPTIEHHSAEARDLLRHASLSQRTFLTVERAEVLEELAADDYRAMAPDWLRSAIMSSQNRSDRSVRSQIDVTQHKEDSMAVKTRTRTKSTRARKSSAKTKSSARKRNGQASSGPSSATKAQVAEVAKLRRDGATWDEVIEGTGIKTNSTGFRVLLEEAGFDKFGRRGGKGKSQARGYGSAKIAK